jgi:hypothetical protein
MTIQTINIGNLVNDGLGDDLRTAFEKVNGNFSELNSQLSITGLNLGNGSKIFKEKNGNELNFRSIVSGRNIFVEELPDAIEIRSTAPNAFIEFFTDAGNISSTDANQGKITIEGANAPAAIGPWANTAGSETKDIEVTTNGTSLVKIRNIIPVTDILTTFDFGPITGRVTTAIQLLMAASNIDFGTIEFPGSLDLDGGKLNPQNTNYN